MLPGGGRPRVGWRSAAATALADHGKSFARARLPVRQRRHAHAAHGVHKRAHERRQRGGVDVFLAGVLAKHARKRKLGRARAAAAGAAGARARRRAHARAHAAAHAQHARRGGGGGGRWRRLVVVRRHDLKRARAGASRQRFQPRKYFNRIAGAWGRARVVVHAAGDASRGAQCAHFESDKRKNQNRRAKKKMRARRD